MTTIALELECFLCVVYGGNPSPRLLVLKYPSLRSGQADTGQSGAIFGPIYPEEAQNEVVHLQPKYVFKKTGKAVGIDTSRISSPAQGEVNGVIPAL